MKVSVVIDTVRPWPAVRDLARHVVEQGVCAVFLPGHCMGIVEAVLESSLLDTPGEAGLQP